MRKFTLSFTCVFLLLAGVSAQSMEGTTTFNKKTTPAIVQEIPYSEAVVSHIVKEEMKRRGYSGKTSKGFLEFKGVQLKEAGPERIDLYIKTERKSRREKDESILTIVTSKGYENFVSRSSDGVVADGIRTFSNSLLPLAEARALELDISSQETGVSKAEKRYQQLLSDSVSLEKKKLQLEEQLARVKEELVKQAEEVASQQKILENLRARRKED